MSQQTIPIPLAYQAKPARQRSFIGHAKLIAALTLVSRVSGLARETVVASCFGAAEVSSAFTIAFSVPNMFRKLLGEGALSSAFIPIYAQAIKSGDDKAANEFAAATVNLLAIVLIGLTCVGELLLWASARFLPVRADTLLIFRLTAIMLPYVFLICGTAFLSAILQVHKRFTVPALTQLPLNVIHICVVSIGARILSLAGAVEPRLTLLQTRLAYWLAGFVLIAGVLQIGMLLPELRAVGFRFARVGNIWTPRMKKMLRLSVPIALSLSVLQVSVLLDRTITWWLTADGNPSARLHILGYAMARPLALGAVARLYWAQMLYQFPLGVFATALATAIFPSLSSDALDKDRTKFKQALRQGILFALLEGLPASIGLILVRYPIVRLIFERGSFTAADTRWVALSLIFYSAAIWAFSLQQILNRAYFAMHDMKMPLVMSIVTIAINTVVEIPLSFTKLGEAGIAAGTCVSFVAQAVVMLVMLDRKVGGLGLKGISVNALKMMAACAAMAGACVWIQHLGILPKQTTHLASLTQLTALVAVGGGVYASICWGLGLKKILKEQ